MKEVQVESYITKYEAIDGTQFTTKDECLKYEQSAKGVLMSRYAPLVVRKDIPECELLSGSGSDDYGYDIVKLEQEADIDVILQLCFLHNSYLLKDTSDHIEKCGKMRELIERSCKAKDYLIIGRGIKGDIFWPMYTRNQLFANICSYCNEDKTLKEAEG